MSLAIDLQLKKGMDCPHPDQDAVTIWVQTALDAAGAKGDFELTVRFTDETEIADLNRTYRGKDGATNILSFPFESPVPISPRLLGDLVICVEVATREAQTQNKALENHYAHLCIHGTLHLLGYDHMTPEDAAVMEPLEIKALAALSIPNPYVCD